MRSRSTLVVLFVAGLLASAMTAVAGDWQRLGQAYVDFHTNPLAIPVNGASGSFGKIKLQVKENALEVRSVKVFVTGGQSFEVPLNVYLGAGKETQPIDVPGGSKGIEKVELSYRGGADDQVMPLVRVFGESS